ncbi:hypothetical protein [Pseudorhodobacter wandonensis]|nr:hypothetical protein [Pseudorhodobacter wandonensis]
MNNPFMELTLFLPRKHTLFKGKPDQQKAPVAVKDPLPRLSAEKLQARG